MHCSSNVTIEENQRPLADAVNEEQVPVCSARRHLALRFFSGARRVLGDLLTVDDNREHREARRNPYDYIHTRGLY